MSSIRSYLKYLKPWKKVLWLVFTLGPPIAITLLTVWLFSLHGTIGFFLWQPAFSAPLVLMIIFAAIGSLFILLNVGKPDKELAQKHPKLKVVAWVFCFISLVVSITFISYIGSSLAEPAGDTEPQLLMCDGTGKNNVPDMAVTYWTEVASEDSLKWGEGALTDSIKEKEAVFSHVFILEDLKPNTEYWYKINGEGDTHKFTTPLVNTTLKFAVSADAHFGSGANRPDISEDILEQIVDLDNEIDLFFLLGDFVEYGWDNSEWVLGLETVSSYTTEIPFRPIIGNHDTFLGGVQHYKNYFYPEEMPLDTGSRLWYRIDVGDIHFFLLDLEWGTETYTQEQKEWFEKEIEDVDKDDWTIVMSHCMFYSSGLQIVHESWADQPSMIEAFEDLFIENDVDLVFSGHNHHAEILEKEDIYYQICGTFGGHPDAERDIESDYSKWYKNIEDDDDFGFFEVNINGDVAMLTFRNKDYDNVKQITVER